MMTDDIEDIYPLSPMQQGMLFHSIYAAGSSMYFEQMSCVLEGEVNGIAFEQAWQAVVDRHSVLRSSFIWEELDAPVQIVNRRVEIPLTHYDWRTFPAGEQSARLQCLLQDDREQGFDFAQPPLMRLTLVRLSEERHQLVWSHHHLLFDGWSLPLLLKEVFASYDALLRNEPLHLPAPRPYRDYIHWLQQQDMAGAEVFWRERLRGFHTPTQLTVEQRIVARDARAESDDNTHDSSDQGQGERRISLTEEATAQLQALARQHQLTLNTIVQGAWALLLSRYSGNQDVVFGATVSGRPAELSGVEQMLGLFINTLPVRVVVNGEQPVVEWLRRLQAEEAEAREFEYTPLVEVQRWSEVERGQSLFDSILVFENYPVDTGLTQEVNSGSAGLEIREVSSFKKTNYPLTLLAATGSQLRLLISYDQERFDDEVIERMLGHLSALLENMTSDPQQRISRLEMLSIAERQQLLVEFNDTHCAFPQDVCLHQLFEQQVERSPDALALTFEDEHLTYAELNGRANQLAHYLQSHGVGLEDRVGVLLERSVEMVVSLLAILKAGAAYVPLDPAYPQERLAFMVEDARLSLLLTDSRLLSAISTPATALLCLDTEWDSSASSDSAVSDSRANLDCCVPPAALAYVIYTSGSTGQPKGAMNTHRGIVNRLLWMQDAYHLTSADTVLQKTPFSFDVSVWEFFWPLLTGARLCVAVPGGHQDAAYLSRVIEAERITTLHFVPSMLQVFVQEPSVSRCAGVLRRVICSGEALGAGLAERFFAEFGEVELHNLYGPTEAAVDVTSWECVQGASERSVPIGKPIANTQVYILDEEQELVAVGVSGEVYLGGEGLARGYLNRAGMTAERFIPHPFSQSGGARLYRTGDVGRYRSDGNIEYLGRTDHQVKVRGFRIELGEIESVLCQHAGVRESIVLAREDTPGDQRLVAYLLTGQEEQQRPSSIELQHFLREKLPEHMIPSVFVRLDEFPLTPNGKLNRRALPVPDSSRPDIADRFVAPTNPLEEDLAQMFSTLLGVERVGIEDNFFELGGHSLLAMQLISRVRADFDMEIGLREFFQTPTVKRLAEMMEAAFLATTEAGEIEEMLSELELIEEDTETNETTQNRH